MSVDPVITAIVTAHNETAWLTRAIRSLVMQVDAPPYEIVVVCDRISDDTAAAIVTAINEAPPGLRIQPVTVNNGDLGESRNAGVKMARGRFICFTDGDDIAGCTWLRQAFEYARRFDNDDFVLHHQHSLMFGAANFFHRHFGSGDPEFSPKDLIQYNAASALAFAPKSLFERFPYRKMDGWAAWEDWHHYCDTLGAGIEHHCVPDSIFMIRMKLNESSLAARMTVRKGALGYMPLFDKRNLPEAEREPMIGYPPPSVMKQIQFAHHRVGEFRIQVDPGIQVRSYPRQVIWDDQAFLRDAVGNAKHVVLVHELRHGGAEKYALDWCAAMKENGEEVVLIETAPGASPWLARAEKVCKVVRWYKRRPMEPQQVAYAAQRAMIQMQLDSLFVCNSELGWALIQENCAVLAKKVIAASFSTFPIPQTGYTSCPPFYLDKQAENLTIITDNERHQKRLLDFGLDRVSVIPPRATYGAASKLRQTRKPAENVRLLWAGRGTPEKGPHMPTLIAASMPEVDVHVWGDVQPMMHALTNIHYRGPFESFEAIDGAYDAYLLTSSFEGMPNTALEAVLAGLPVIGTDVGDVRKVAGALFPPPLSGDLQKHVGDACKAIAGFFAERGRYDHAPVLAIVEEWRQSFAKRVKEIIA